MKNLIFYTLFLIGLSCCTPTLFAQCDGSIKPVSNEETKYKGRGNRCEGFFTADVAANRLRFVSFTLGDFRFANNDENEVIIVKSNEPKLNLRAEGIPNDLYYRMDAQLKSDSLVWPVKDVLFKEESTRYARNIGLLAFKMDSAKVKIYHPVKAKGRKTMPDPNSLPLIKLTCTTKLSVVEWRVKDEKEEKKYQRLDRTYFQAYSTIYLRLPADVKGEKTIQISAQEADSGRWLKLNIPVKI